MHSKGKTERYTHTTRNRNSNFLGHVFLCVSVSGCVCVEHPKLIFCCRYNSSMQLHFTYLLLLLLLSLLLLLLSPLLLVLLMLMLLLLLLLFHFPAEEVHRRMNKRSGRMRFLSVASVAVNSATNSPNNNSTYFITFEIKTVNNGNNNKKLLQHTVLVYNIHIRK